VRKNAMRTFSFLTSNDLSFTKWEIRGVKPGAVQPQYA
jgi:hypothetical protein